MLPDAALRRFVRGIARGAIGRRDGDWYVLEDGRRAPAEAADDLVASGALAGDGRSCRASAETLGWVKRAHLDVDAFAAQHRLPATDREGRSVNLAESPLARLAAGPGPAFLGRHHVEAGERVRRLVERAHLQPRLTMSYSAAHVAGGGGAAGDISDLAADARRELNALYLALPGDCAGVVVDVCGLLKGLQQVERERGWPRRSAKLVLRIGLEQLAQKFGLAPAAVGRAGMAPRRWMEEGARPTTFE